MNDNQPWPLMGQAAASRAAEILVRYAAWQLADCAAYDLPLAGFLQEKTIALLVAATDEALSPASAAMHGSLLETRSDGLIIGTEGSRREQPEIALGLWRSGRVTWHQPLVPWLAEDGAMWLVPAPVAPAGSQSAYKLVPRHLRVDTVPWRAETERRDGFTRAIAAFAAVGEDR
ncbi:hypothetical protein HRV97_16920 [Sphingomonas sp. HHU CXW]|uniref:Uncharacterized protein n=1 Tax=Sphingomonas hominis TaxID=2741495 RepID=A0ABX2JQV6_9SPHN|nr:hypothetical protein [Sphingomonas hominis]NTS66824.1 hypothetical protein [Sphingomonas hominis]